MGESVKTRVRTIVLFSHTSLLVGLFAFAFVFSPMNFPDANALDIAVNGKSDYSISGNPSAPAVKDLQSYIEKMSGAKLPIVPLASNPVPEKAIVVGDDTAAAAEKPALAPQEYRLKVDGSRVLISGGAPDGISNGVYGLLDDHWGCRFLTVKEDYIPEKKTLSLPDNLNERRGPSIRDRLWIQVNGLMDNPDWRRRNRMTWEKQGCAGHDIYQWLPPDKYFKDHPDWYPLGKDNLRKPGCDWLCWTNEDMLKEMTRLVREKMAKTPADKYISVGQGDGFSSPCNCSKCRTLVDKYGSEAAPIVWGLNKVIAETVKDFPKHEIAYFAYFDTGIPPIKGADKLVPHPNLCATFVLTNDAMKNIDAPGNAKIKERFLGWKSLTDNLQIWSWSVGFKSSLSPFPNYKAMGENTKWFAPKVRGFMHQMYGDGEWYVLRQWVLARLMWDSRLDVEETERELLRCYYGEDAAKPLWKIIDRMQKAAEKSQEYFNAVFGSEPKSVQEKLFPPDDMEFYRKTYEEAIAAAEKSNNPAFAERVKDTMARSFSILYFSQPRPLKRVMIEGKDWMLPDGDPRLALSAAKLSDVLKKTVIFEWFGPELGRRKFMNNAGGPVELVENDRIKLGFCPALDGVLCSFVDKETNAELLRIGPPGQGEQSGIHHMIKSSSAADHTVTVEKNEDVTRVTLAGPVITWSWMVFPAFRHDRVYEFAKNRPGFTVNSYIYADSKNPAFGLYNIYKAPEYNLALDKPLYDPHVTMRFGAPSPRELSMLSISPKGTQLYKFDVGTSCQVSLPEQRKSEERLTMYFYGLEPDKILSIATPWQEWETISVEVDQAQKELFLKFDGPKLESKKDIRTMASFFEVDILPKESVEHYAPVMNLSLRDSGDKRPEISWEKKEFQEFAGYHIYAAKGKEEFKRLTEKPIVKNEWQPGASLENEHWRFRVTVVDNDGKEGAPSPSVSWRNIGNDDHNRPLLVSNNGAGDYMTIQEAFAALPRTEWKNDRTIQVLDTSNEFPDGYDGAQLPDETIQAAKGRILHLVGVGGKPRIRGTVDLNGKGAYSDSKALMLTAEIRSFRFVAPAEISIEAPGAGSVIAENEFLQVKKGIVFESYKYSTGTVIERNFFHKNSAFGIIGVELGGTEKQPLIVRNNIFVGSGIYLNGGNTFIINNTFDLTSIRVEANPTFTIANNIFAYRTPFSMVRGMDAYAKSRQMIDGNVFQQAVPFARVGDKGETVQTLADWINGTGLGKANRELAPLWVANVSEEKKPTDNIPQLKKEHVPGERPEYYMLRPESPCLSGGLKGLPVGEVDFFGNKRNPDFPGIGAVTRDESK